MADDPPQPPEKRHNPNPTGKSAPDHIPTDQTRSDVAAWAKACTDQKVMALLLGISEKTLRKHYRNIIDTAHAQISVSLGAKMVALAVAGEFPPLRFVLERKLGWVERKEHSIAGDKLIDDMPESEVDERIRKLEEKYGPSPTDAIN